VIVFRPGDAGAGDLVCEDSQAGVERDQLHRWFDIRPIVSRVGPLAMHAGTRRRHKTQTGEEEEG
jgi:hypothetical protein